jgi:hypothetical protein
MIYQVVSALREVTSLSGPAHNLLIRSDDTFIAGYPKSGNTWIRILISNYLDNSNFELEKVDKYVADIYKVTEFKLLMKKKRLLKTHEIYNAKVRKAIYVVRDPRDVAISMFHYSKRVNLIEDDCNFDSFISAFLDGELMYRFGNWSSNSYSWWQASMGNADILLIRYEDLRSETEIYFTKILEFLELSIYPEKIASAIKSSTFDNLQLLENQAGKFEGQRSEISFFRSGGQRGYKEDMSNSNSERIIERFQHMMHVFNYC